MNIKEGRKSRKTKLSNKATIHRSQKVSFCDLLNNYKFWRKMHKKFSINCYHFHSNSSKTDLEIMSSRNSMNMLTINRESSWAQKLSGK